MATEDLGLDMMEDRLDDLQRSLPTQTTLQFCDISIKTLHAHSSFQGQAFLKEWLERSEITTDIFEPYWRDCARSAEAANINSHPNAPLLPKSLKSLFKTDLTPSKLLLHVFQAVTTTYLSINTVLMWFGKHWLNPNEPATTELSLYS